MVIKYPGYKHIAVVKQIGLQLQTISGKQIIVLVSGIFHRTATNYYINNKISAAEYIKRKNIK